MYFLRNRDGLGRALKAQIRPITCVASENIDYALLLRNAIEIQDQHFFEGDVASPELPDSEAEDDSAAVFPQTNPSPSLCQSEPSQAKRTFPNFTNPQSLGIEQSSAQKSSKRRRREKREENVRKKGHVPREEVRKRVLAKASPRSVGVDLSTLPATSCGYQARYFRKGDEAPEISTLEQALHAGYQLVPWNGRDPVPLLDLDGLIWGVLAGRIEEKKYSEACERLFTHMQGIGCELSSQADERDRNRRGNFPVINIGVTHEKGMYAPITLHDYRADGSPGRHTLLTEEILKDKDLELLASFQSYCYSFWCPGIYKEYVEKLNELWAGFPSLRRNFSHSVFPCLALNCGENVWTKSHRDSMNRASGWCAITSLGQFDPKMGGHLLLPELKLAIEFPPGSVILIPSATVTHANIPVQKGDKRASFTQFAAGGLFRFIDNAFMTEKDLKKKKTKLYTEKGWQINLFAGGKTWISALRWLISL